MNGFETVLYHLSASMETPKPLGAFHLIWCALVVILSVFAAKKGGRLSRRSERVLLWAVWGALVVFEIYKELNAAATFTDAGVEWRYAWGAFPFQFCDLPFYILPLIALVPGEKARGAAKFFFATYVFSAGVIVYCYPTDVFCSTVGVNIQTMFHHGAQIVLGVYFAADLLRRGRLTLKNFPGAFCVFLAAAATAILLNRLSPLFTDDYFNLFYIDTRFPHRNEIVRLLLTNLPYPVFVLLYLIGMTAVAIAAFLLFRSADLLYRKIRAGRGAEEAEAEDPERTGI